MIKISAVFIPLLLILALLIKGPTVLAATSVNLFQITTDGSQQTSPFIYKNLVAYTSLSDIWGYNLDSKLNFPIIERPGQQFLTGLDGNLIVYEDVDDTSNYDIRLYDIKKGKDQLIAGGPGSQTSGVTNGKYVVYIDGGACGSIHAYNLKKKTDEVISPTGCQPLRISGDLVIWPYGAPGGSNIYGYDLDKGKPEEIVIEDNIQESPNIFQNKVVWLHYITGALGDYNAIKMKDLKSGNEKTIYESSSTSLQWPAISNRYVVWSESSAAHVGGVKAADLKTGEVFEIQGQGPHQNSHTSPALWKDTAVWQAWRTGNGDVYGAEFSH